MSAPPVVSDLALASSLWRCILWKKWAPPGLPGRGCIYMHIIRKLVADSAQDTPGRCLTRFAQTQFDFNFRELCRFRSSAMALQVVSPISDTALAAEMAKLETDFHFLLGSSKVPVQVMAKLASLGVTATEVFSKVVASEAELKQLLKDDVGLDPLVCLANRVAAAKLCSAWETASVRGRKRKEEEAEHRLGQTFRASSRSQTTSSCARLSQRATASWMIVLCPIPITSRPNSRSWRMGSSRSSG